MSLKTKIVSLKHLDVSFHKEKNKPLFSDLSLDVFAGESLTILGPSGCGKSTLLKVILGLIQPGYGKVSVFDSELLILKKKAHSDLLKRIGVVFQQGALFDSMTVKENIMFALEQMTNVSLKECEELIDHFLEQVNLKHVKNRTPAELSGGMRRRIGFVRALIINPELTLLDEPTAGLDPVTTTVIIDMIQKISQKSGTTLLFFTSNIDVAFRFSPKVALLKEGKILGKGSREELLDLNDPWITHFLTVRDRLYS